MLKVKLQRLNSILGISNSRGHALVVGLCLVMMPLFLTTCASPTETEVSIEAEMPRAPGERIVLFPNHRRDASPASSEFARCLRTELAERGTPYAAVMDTTEFQDAMFPWFEFAHAPQTAEEMDSLLSRPRVREQIIALNVRYLISMVFARDADGFPGMICGGYPGAGCLGVAWESKVSKLDAIVWDLKTGKEAGGMSVSSSGKSLALGVIIPIVFIAYTDEDACEAMAAKLGEFLDGKTKLNSFGQ